VGGAAGVQIIGAAVGIGLRLVAPSAFAGLPVWLVVVTVSALPFVLAWFYASFIALATDRYEAYVLPPLLQAILALLLAVPGALLYDVDGAVVGLTVASAVVGASSVAWALRRLPQTIGATSAEPAQLLRAISFGIKGYAANAMQLLNYRLDLFVLAAVASTATVGVYSVAVAVTRERRSTARS